MIASTTDIALVSGGSNTVVEADVVVSIDGDLVTLPLLLLAAAVTQLLWMTLAFLLIVVVVVGLGATQADGLVYDRWIVEGVVRADQAVHFLVTAVLTSAAITVIRSRFPWTPVDAPLVIVAGLVALGLGALNEAFEFVSAPRMTLAVGDGQNTGWDLVFNAAGACSAAVWWLAVGRGDRQSAHEPPAGRPDPATGTISARS